MSLNLKNHAELTTIAVIIVNWNGQEFIKKCLSHVIAQQPKNFVVYFVDNGSTDNSLAIIRQNFPEIKIIALKQNFGTVIGRNMGIQTALKDPKIKYIITLDSDAYPYPNCFQSLVSKAKSDPKIGIINSKILYGNPPVIQTTGMMPSENIFFLCQNADQPASSCNQTLNILAPCTASALIKREVIEQVGLFDKNYFMYQDDVDFGIRARLYNWQIIYEPTSIAYHYASQSAKKTNLINFYVTRNAILLGIKFYPWTLLIQKIYNLKNYQGDKVTGNITKKSAQNYLLFIKYLMAAFKKLPIILQKRRKIFRRAGKNPHDVRDLLKTFKPILNINQ